MLQNRKLNLKGKRAAALVLAIALVFVFAFAALAGAAVQTAGIDVTAATADTAGVNWTWTQSSKTLALNGVNIAVAEGSAVMVPDGSTIELTGLNTVTTASSTYDPALTGPVDYQDSGLVMTFKGSGILEVSNTGSGYGEGIMSDDGITIQNGYIKAQSESAAVCSYGAMTVTGGYIDASGIDGGSGISVDGKYTQSGGYVKASANSTTVNNLAMFVAGGLEVTGGYLEATVPNTTNDSNIAIRVSNGTGSFGFRNTGGVVKATAGNATYGSYAIKSDLNIALSGGVTIAHSGTAAITAAIYSGFSSGAGSITLTNSEAGKKADGTTAVFANGVSGNYHFFANASAGSTPSTDVVVAKHHSNASISDATLDGHYGTAGAGSVTGVTGGSYVEHSGFGFASVDGAFTGTVNGTLVGKATNASNCNGIRTTGAGVALGGTLIGISKAEDGIVIKDAGTITGNLLGISETYTGVSFDNAKSYTMSSDSASVMGISPGATANERGIENLKGTLTKGNITAVGKSGYAYVLGSDVDFAGVSVTAVNEGSNAVLNANTKLKISSGKVWAYNKDTSGPSVTVNSFDIATTMSVKTLGSADSYGAALGDRASTGNTITEQIAYFSAGPAPTLYEVTFDNNGGMGGTLPTKLTQATEGAAVTIPAPSAASCGAKSGFTIDTTKWATTAGGTTYVNAGSYTPAANVTLYAVWTANAPKTLSSIAITKAPTKTTYVVGESFSKTGMVVTGTYSDNSKNAVISYSIAPEGPLALTDTKVTVTYTEEGVTKTATQAIKVGVLSANLGGFAYGKNAIKLTWGKTIGADKYEVWGTKCGTTKFKKLATLTGTTFTHKKLKSKTPYKFYVKAYKGATFIKQSDFGIHVITAGSKKYDNAKSLTITSPTSVTFSTPGERKEILGEAKTGNKKKLYLHKGQRGVRFKSTDKRVATVDMYGEITAVAGGTCQILVATNNGISKYVTVTVTGPQ